MKLRIFTYLPDLDSFVPAEPYASVARELGLAEWNPVVWIGRLFALDNDFGEHWFDNWELREQKEILMLERDMEILHEPEVLLIVDLRRAARRSRACKPRTAARQRKLPSLAAREEDTVAALLGYGEKLVRC